MKKSPVVHFEMPYKDGKRVSEFYSKVFGWGMHDTGPDMGKYILAGTTPTDNDRMILNKGEINGGFFPVSEQTGENPIITIQVDDIKIAMEEVKAAGGEVLSEPVEIPNVGMYVAIKDTEGSRVSLLQPSNKA